MFILASSSPRRIQILKTIIEDFVAVKPTFDETLISKKSKNYAMEESLNKALSVKSLAKPQDFILSCDTIIIFNNEIIGKPKDRNDAFLTLKKLSNNTHYVISGYTILHEDKIINREIKSQITFSELDDDFINYYIDNYEVMDKAGSYAIQDEVIFKRIKKMEGSYLNIMGLPLEDIKEQLKLLNAL